MEILTKQNDDPEFVELVKHVIAGCVNDGFPSTIIVIKIDNWFDHKWLGYRKQQPYKASLTCTVMQLVFWLAK